MNYRLLPEIVKQLKTMPEVLGVGVSSPGFEIIASAPVGIGAQVVPDAAARRSSSNTNPS